MATPIGHALAGYAVYRMSGGALRADKGRLLVFCLVAAVAPDLDFLPGIFLGQPALYHQGISHSLFFSVMVGCGLGVVSSQSRGTVVANWGWFSLAYTSHLVIDLFGSDLRPPYGQPLFWPLSSKPCLAPFPLFWGVQHAPTTSATITEWIFGILQTSNLVALGIEVLVLLPVVLVVYQLQRFRYRYRTN